jgi:hypothetical protein
MNNNNTAQAIRDTLISPSNEYTEATNVVDGLFAIARAIGRVAQAIDDSGLDKIVPALDHVADALTSISDVANALEGERHE